MTDFTDTRPVLAMLRETGLPAVYRQWAPAKPPPMPYIVFYRSGRADLGAEDGNFFKAATWRAELYSEGPDFDAMARIEEILDAHQAAYQADEIGGTGLDVPMTAVYDINLIGASL